MSASRPWAVAAGALAVTVRLTPKGGRDAIEGIEQLADGRCVLKVRVRAAASEGAANSALLKLVAKTLAVPPRDVSLAAGATSRIKRLLIAGHGPTLTAALEKIAGLR
ncbi:MAG: DUF167 domain-containing protein [Deltaproteobacteria bacterium]|nr:DUF167 domain-containing protein [Deltaproteobacteria bacterium]